MNTLKQVIKLSFCLILIVLFSAKSIGQESLQEKYQNLLESTETFQQYKVIPRTDLNNFWAAVNDSLRQDTRTISQLNSRLSAQQASLDSLRTQLSDVRAQLDKSQTLNDTIYFVGMPFTKLGYHILVWAIIVALAVLGILAYLMFIRSNKVTTRSKKELESLRAEFEAHKDKAREKQVKLKRELQTAVNTIDEIKRGRR